MRTRLLAVPLCGLVLAGCTAGLDVSGTRWIKADLGVPEASWDEILCVRVASDAGDTYESGVGGIADAVRFAIRERGRRAAYESCMREKGYRPAAG